MKMDEMQRLLTAYYDGVTDEHEEKRLKEALRTEQMSGQWKMERRILTALEEACPANVHVPDDLKERLSRMIDCKDGEEPHFIRRNRTRRNWRWIAGVAATFLLLMGVGLGVAMWEESVPPTPQDTFTNPQDAYRALQATLSEVSRNWRAGMEQVQEAQMQIGVVNEEVKQELSK